MSINYKPAILKDKLQLNFIAVLLKKWCKVFKKLPHVAQKCAADASIRPCISAVGALEPFAAINGQKAGYITRL